MFKVLKNLKESIFAVITIVILLCIQAYADLELPDYTSKIVNIGIQESDNDLGTISQTKLRCIRTAHGSGI